MRLITISAAVLLGSALSAANAQELRAGHATPSTKNNVVQIKGVSGPGMHFVSGGSDTCGTATAIAGTGLFAGDNTGATTDGPAAPCVTMGADVWYDWTAMATGVHTFSFCAAGGGTANYDTALVIYNGNTCIGTVAACNDDTCSLQSQVAFGVTNGNVYKIRVGGFGSTPAAGSYVMSISSACCGTMITPFCEPGIDAGLIPCPCANPPAGGGLGCNNFGAGPAGGATLDATGVGSLATDTLLLMATGENDTSLTVFWTGTAANSPPGVAHGAGVRCVTGLKRLYTGSASGGAISRPGGGDPSVSVRTAAAGAPITVGQTRHYFTIYRDPNAAGPCMNPASIVNLTSALSVLWAP